VKGLGRLRGAATGAETDGPLDVELAGLALLPLDVPPVGVRALEVLGGDEGNEAAVERDFAALGRQGSARV
jgi:hypothetical protein